MRFTIAAAAAVITGIICLATSTVIGVIVCIGVLFYLASLLIAPKTKCRSCDGSGDHKDPLGSSGIRKCWTCDGRKEYARLGTRLLRPQVHRGIQGRRHGRNW